MSVFEKGNIPSLDEVLQTREKRVLFQRELCRKYPEGTVISFKCNIPGPVKNNAAIKQLFETGKEKIWNILSSKGITVKYFKEMDLNTGPECFFVAEESAKIIKRLMIEIEETTPVGRLFDNDVLYANGKQVETVSRTQLGHPVRRCFICSNNAKNCARSRTHTFEEIYLKMEKLLSNFNK